MHLSIERVRLKLTILPLSLNRLGHPDDANPHSEFNKLIPPKWLRQDISQLIVGVDLLHRYPSFFYALPDEMVSCVDVLTVLMKDRVSAQLHS
jgi:hypothetical protein